MSFENWGIGTNMSRKVQNCCLPLICNARTATVVKCYDFPVSNNYLQTISFIFYSELIIDTKLLPITITKKPFYLHIFYLLYCLIQ